MYKLFHALTNSPENIVDVFTNACQLVLKNLQSSPASFVFNGLMTVESLLPSFDTESSFGISLLVITQVLRETQKPRPNAMMKKIYRQRKLKKDFVTYKNIFNLQIIFNHKQLFIQSKHCIIKHVRCIEIYLEKHRDVHGHAEKEIYEFILICNIIFRIYLAYLSLFRNDNLTIFRYLSWPGSWPE